MCTTYSSHTVILPDAATMIVSQRIRSAWLDTVVTKTVYLDHSSAIVQQYPTRESPRMSKQSIEEARCQDKCQTAKFNCMRAYAVPFIGAEDTLLAAETVLPRYLWGFTSSQRFTALVR